MNVNDNYHRRKPYLRPYNDIPGFFALKTRSTAALSSGNTGLFLFEKGPKPSPECINYLQEFLLFDEEVIEADTGVYTWALKRFDTDGNLRLIAAPALSKQEVGTLHANLDGLTMPGKILIAGELQIAPDRTFTYNILSGTYSMKLPPKEKDAGMKLLEGKLAELGASKIVRAGGGYGAIFEATNITLPNYAVTNYDKFCGMRFHSSVTGKRGGQRKTRRLKKKRARTLKRAHA